MKVSYSSIFIADLKSLKNTPSYAKIKNLVFDEIPHCKNLLEILHLKKIKNSTSFYRIRIGSYRIGLFLDKDTVVFQRILHRKDMYRYFP